MVPLPPEHRRERNIPNERDFAENGYLLGLGPGIDAGALSAFNEVVAPLEAKAGDLLTGPGRAKCLRAFCGNPERFERLVAKALDGGNRPIGLLVYMVKCGDGAA
jgi:hypothetical protein